MFKKVMFVRCQCGAGDFVEGDGVLRLLLLLLAISHTLVPLALSNAGLVVRRSRLDVLHHAFDGGSGLVAVAVHCVAGW